MKARYYGRRLLSLIFVVVIVFTAASCTSDSNEKASYELSLAHFFPGTHPAETVFVQGWITAIEEATNGQVKITSYPGETRLNAPDVYEGVVEGSADIGLSCFAYTRGRFPMLEAFELPGVIYKDSAVASKVAWEGIKQLSPKEVSDTKLMMVIATGPGDLFTKDPIRSLEDIQGMEIRATGLSAKTIEVLGGVPVAMAQSEAYESLSRGIVRGNFSPVEVLKGWKHAEVTQYLTRTPFLYNTLFFVTMNLDTWNTIPSDLQDTILKVNESFLEDVGYGLWDMQNEEALTWALEEQGMEEIVLSEEEAQRWIEKVNPIQEEFKINLKNAGIEEDVLKVVTSLADKYNSQ